MKQALIFCLGMVLLFVIGLVAGQKVFKHHRPGPQQVAEAYGTGSIAQTGGSSIDERNYKRIRFSFMSFDLANGLTRSDFEHMPSHVRVGFIFLIGGLFLVRLLKKPKRP
ncbi:MAG: hypothetical protein WCA08_25650 [Desulfoferrobacter sp.]